MCLLFYNPYEQILVLILCVTIYHNIQARNVSITIYTLITF
jgi:hypothetical protein